MNEVVKYHNDMSSVNFPDFTPTDHNVFMAICYECKGKGTEEHLVYFDKLKELSGFASKDDRRFMKYIRELTGKLHGIYYRQEKEDGGFKSFGLFETFETVGMKTNRPALKVEVSKNFAYILNGDAELPEGILPLLSAGYTSFELEQHNSLVSVYSKMAFRQLKRFKRTGWWYVTVDEFRRLLDVPASYEMKEVNRRIIKPIMEELPPYFEDLELERIKGGPTGRQIIALKFTFKPQPDKGIWTEREIFESKYCCPECGKPLYSIWKDSGEEFFGHKDGWRANAACRRTYSSLQEIIRELKQKGLDVPQEVESDDSAQQRPGGYAEKAGFSCRKCGRPLYVLYNKKGEMFYGHPDGWKEDALCKTTYGSIAEIKGYSETPTRADHADYDLVDAADTEAVNRIQEMVGNIVGTFETIKN